LRARSASGNSPPMSPLRMAVAPAALLAAIGVVFFWELGTLPFYAVGEPREALQVQEEFDHGDWILPLRNGTELPSKPPLFHWLGGLSALALGRADELAARLPSALLATATVLAVVWFAARRWDAAAGLYAGFVLATSVDFIRFARAARVDMTLTACVTAAWMLFDRAIASPLPPPLPLWGFYLCMGLATLAKGPVGIALPSATAVAYLALRGELRRWRDLQVVRGLALAVAIPALWYLLAIITGGMSFVRKQVMRENIIHFLGTGVATSNESHPAYYYASALLGSFAPWSVFLIPLAVYLVQIRRQPQRRPYDLPLLWAVIVIAFYSVAASKRAMYILSAYPGFAVALGAWWSQVQREPGAIGAPVRWLLYVAVGAAAVAAGLVSLLLVAYGVGLDPLEWIRPFLHRKDQMNLPLIRAAIAASWLIAVAWAAALFGAALLLYAGARRARWQLVFAALVLVVVATCATVSHSFEPRLARDRTYQPFMATVLRTVGDDRLFFWENFDYGAVFYARRHIPVASGALPEAPAWLMITEPLFARLPAADQSRLRVVERSEGTGPAGRDRYLLVRVSE